MITYYVDFTLGDEGNNGLSQSAPLKYFAGMNSSNGRTTLIAGNSIVGKRGETWREELIVPSSGSAGLPITFGAYGSGNKPKLFMSYQRNNTSDWTDEGSNIWSNSPYQASGYGGEKLANPSFDTVTTGWQVSLTGTGDAAGSRTTTEGEWDSTPAGYKIVCVDGGTTVNGIQFLTNVGLSVTANKVYKLTFKAKASEAFTLPKVVLFKGATPWTVYYSAHSLWECAITTDWATYTIYFKCNTTATNARLTWYLGNALPDGATFYIDTISFTESNNSNELQGTGIDVGNIIFNNEESCGVKKWLLSDIDAQGKFFYDSDYWILKMYSISNPATYYSNIEAAITLPVIDVSEKGYITIENLDFRYTGQDGIWGNGHASACHHITIQDNDFSYLGGGQQSGTTRFGDGIMFWDNSNNITVRRNFFKEIYDVAFSCQGTGSTIQYIYVYYNVFTKTHLGMNVWMTGGTLIDNVYFENNTGSYSGYEWGAAQRPDVGAECYKFGATSGGTTVTNVFFRNNIAYESTVNLVKVDINAGTTDFTLDNNLYYTTTGNLIYWKGTSYTIAEFEDYKTASGKDTNSPTPADPLFRSTTDFHLQTGSPCINSGTDVGLITDYDGRKVPQVSTPSIGAYEFVVGVKPTIFRRRR